MDTKYIRRVLEQEVGPFWLPTAFYGVREQEQVESKERKKGVAAPDQAKRGRRGKRNANTYV